MAKLWFQNSEGNERIIAECKTWSEVSESIDKFIDKCNENKPKAHQFKSYYKRLWEENGRTKIDVGSWSEFFYWEAIITGATMGPDGDELEYDSKGSSND